MLGWHFVGETLRDGRPVPADGEWLVHEGTIEPCKTGLHMSVCPFDALQYAPGGTLCRVELDGEIIGHGNPVDKYVGRRRKILARIDATHLLRRFAADQALSVASLWNMPVVVREYLESLDESKRAAAWAVACDAAWATACDATGIVTWAVVRTVAWDAAKNVAWAAAWAVACDAAWATACDATGIVTWAVVRKEFVKRVHLAFGINE